MPDDDLPLRLTLVERAHADFRETTERHIERLDAAIGEVRAYMTAIGEKVDDRMDEIRSSLDKMRSEAIDTMPAWAAHASERKSAIISILASLVAALAAAIAGVLLGHG